MFINVFVYLIKSNNKINKNINELHFLLFPTVYKSTHFTWYVI